MPQTTPEREAWLATRRLGVGGSDAASLFSEGWGCRRRLWYDKTGTPEDFPREENKLMAMGKILEAYFAEEYAKETGRNTEVADEAFVHPEIPQLRVNVDRGVFRDGIQGVLEIKSSGRAAFYKYKRQGMPVDYVLQVQHGLAVTGCSFGSFALGCRDDGKLLHWDVERSEALVNEIKTEVPRFWEQVVKGEAPERLEVDDPRCQSCSWRTTCHGAALAGAPLEGTEYVPDESLRPLVLEYIERRALRKQADDLLEDTKAELQAALGDRGMVTAAGAKIQYYKITKKEYVVKSHEERPLRIYPGKKS